MRFSSRTLLSLASNMTSLGAQMMLANATSIIVANTTVVEIQLQQTLAYVWVVFLSILLGCIIVTTVLEAICKQHNVKEITWTCTRIADCRWRNNILNTANEHRCGTDKICCPERTNGSPTQTPKPTPTPTPQPTRPPTKPTPPRTRPTASLPKDYARIAKRKCTEYAQYRYVTECIGGDLPGQKEVCGPKLDCIDDTVVLVVGGRDADEKEYPHMALIGSGTDVDNINWSCGGSLISERFVLSAAHCTKDGTSLRARWVAVGLLLREQATGDKLNENVFPILRIYNHPNYKDPKADYDITLYEVKPLRLNPYVRPICLHTNDPLPRDGIITGWGITELGTDVVNVLQEANITFMADTKCKTRYNNDKNLVRGYDGKLMVCAGDETGKRDSCLGDSGGPLQIKQIEACMYTQIGVTSLGDFDCGNGSPAIYTRVASYIDWIGKIVWPDES